MIYWKRHLLAVFACVTGLIAFAVILYLLPTTDALHNPWVIHAITIPVAFSALVLAAHILPQGHRSQSTLIMGGALMMLFAAVLLINVPASRYAEQLPHMLEDALPWLISITGAWFFFHRKGQ